jgi:hypothetical protein
MRILNLIGLCLSFAAFACSSAGGSLEGEPVDTLSAPLMEERYVDARSFFTEEADIDAWYTLTLALRDGFDAICGDTFCEGDYSNYESHGFRCSVEESSGVIGRCAWMFAASTDEIDPSTGELLVQGQLWSCAMPIAESTPAQDFLSALSRPGEPPLYATLPGSELSLYDGLVVCV